jgi:hypothetical protein
VTETESLDDAALRKARARELERLRRAVQKLTRPSGGTNPPAEPWRLLSVSADALDDVLATLCGLADAIRRDGVEGAATMTALTALHDALTGAPSRQLLPALRELLVTASGIDPAEMACCLQAAGLEIVSRDVLPALRALVTDGPTAADLDVLYADWGPCWRRFADVALVASGHAPQDPAAFFAEAPLHAIDVYVDSLPEAPHPQLWADRPPEDVRYLTARTHQALLSEDDLAALGWWDEYHRRRYARGLPYQSSKSNDSELYHLLNKATRGDASVLGRLAELLPPENAVVIKQLRDGAKFGSWPAELYADRGLWLLIARLWAPADVIAPRISSFHQWAAFRRAYDLTLERNFEAAEDQIEAFGELPEVASPLEKEVINLRAYLTLVYSDKIALDEATAILRRVRRSPAVQENLKWLERQRRATTNDRAPVENPYLFLGVDHGAPTREWKEAWRAIRSADKDDLDSLSAINDARDRIMALERDNSDGLGQVFVVPLDKKHITPHLIEPSPRLIPRPGLYHRNTSQEDAAAAMARLRREAVTSFLSNAEAI